VVTAGAWSGGLLADLALPLQVLRVVQLWFAAPAALDEDRGVPCFGFEEPEGFFYGFLRRPGATEIKVALHAGTALADPDDPAQLRREITDEDAARVEGFVWRRLPGVGPRFARGKTCLHTMTPDEHFVIDRHPEHPHVVLAAGFSGHGFKFASVVGECLAELALDGRTRHPIDFLGLHRRRFTG
jgi:glycine/D-amino acid oxidase-like deaminating enzyme